MPDTAPQRPASPTDAAPAVAAPVIASATLLKGRNVVSIEHRGIIYRLQETRAGKLILTK